MQNAKSTNNVLIKFTNSPSLKAWTLSPDKGLPSLVQLKVGIGLPLTGVVILNLRPATKFCSVMVTFEIDPNMNSTFGSALSRHFSSTQ